MKRVESQIGESSRHSAHNTDDLFERWLFRHGVEERPLSDLMPEMRTPRDPNKLTEELSTETQARNQIALALTRLKTTEDTLSGLRDAKVRKSLIAKKHDLLRYIQAGKQFLREWSTLCTTETLRQLVGDNDEELGIFAQYLLEYKNRDKSGPKLPKEENDRIYAIFHLVQDKLMERKLSFK